MTSRLRKNDDRRPTPSPDPREAARSGAEGLPLLPRGLASRAFVQGRGWGRRRVLPQPPRQFASGPVGPASLLVGKMRLHRGEVVFLPPLLVSRALPVRDLGMHQRQPGAGAVGLEEDLEAGIRAPFRELGGAPGLDDPTRWIEFQRPAGDVTVPNIVRTPDARGYRSCGAHERRMLDRVEPGAVNHFDFRLEYDADLERKN